jgi:hypothetical protein
MDFVFGLKLAVFFGVPCFAVGWALIERRTLRRLKERAGIEDE